MRLGIRVLGLIYVCAAMASPVAAAAPVSVQDIVAAPNDHMDKVVSVHGVLLNNNDWRLCSLPLLPNTTWQMNFGAKACIEVVSYKQLFSAQFQKYEGAVVTITGPYWNECLPDIQASLPPIVRGNCPSDAKATGSIGPSAIRIEDYIALRNPPSDQSKPAAELFSSPRGVEFGEFANALAHAMTRRDVDAIAMLYRDFARGRIRVWLPISEREEHWRFFAPEMQPKGSPPLREWIDFRLFSATQESTSGQLCYCREQSCEHRWPTTTDDLDGIQNLATPYVCFEVEHNRGRWWLK